MKLQETFHNKADITLTAEDYENLIYVANMDGMMMLPTPPVAKIEMTNDKGVKSLFEFEECDKKITGGRGMCKLYTF